MEHVRNVLVLFAPLWVGATLVFGMAGVCYALFSNDVWSARQPVVVRDEATNSVDRMGRFSSSTELKAAQETLLEMTQNPEVVRNALQEIGPANGEDLREMGLALKSYKATVANESTLSRRRAANLATRKSPICKSRKPQGTGNCLLSSHVRQSDGALAKRTASSCR